MSPVICTDVSDELAEQVEDEREGTGDERESRSQAMKRLIREGLEYQEQPDGFIVTKSGAVIVAGIAAFLASFGEVTLSEPVGIAGGVLAAGAASYSLLKLKTDLLDGS